MALDGETWVPEAWLPINQKESRNLTIGWTGAPVNLPFLKSILPPLQELIRKHECVRFAIHCGVDPCWHDIKYDYIPYEKGKEPEVVRTFDIGLLPLPRDDFADGKSPIKVLQYLASGVAMVCSRTPATLDFSNKRTVSLYAETSNDWHECMEKLVKDQSLLNEMSRNGREQFDEYYEINQTYPIQRKALAGQLN
jgi:glycosyltransferase involved in cell wall biosynthesis